MKSIKLKIILLSMLK